MERVISDSLVCDVSDVSSSGGVGDRFVTTPDGMRMLQETKAKERLNSKLDLDKFRDDVRRGLANGRVNAGLFVSLKTKHIPNAGGPYSLEWLSVPGDEDGVTRRAPLVYVASADPAVIGLAAQATHWLCLRALAADAEAALLRERGTSEAEVALRELSDERRELAERLPVIFGRLEKLASDVDDRLGMLNKLVELAEAEKRRHVSLATLVESLAHRVTFVTAPGAVEAAILAEACELVRARAAADGGKTPRLADFPPIQRQQIQNAGGIKAVVGHIKSSTR